MGKKILLLGLILFASLTLTTLFKNTAKADDTTKLLAQAIPTIDPSQYDSNGNIPSQSGYDTVWTPGVGWQYIPIGGGSDPNAGIPTEDDSGTYCAQWQKEIGAICKIPTNSGCGCPTGWACNYIGRADANGQTIQCLPPGGDGIDAGKSCSPAGALCESVTVGNVTYEGSCNLTSQGYKCGAGTPISGGDDGGDQGGTGDTGIGGGDNGEDIDNANEGRKTCFRDSDCESNQCTKRFVLWGYCEAPDPDDEEDKEEEEEQQLTCDPVENGEIDEADLDLWKKEFTKEVTTAKTACLSPNNAVDLLGFQAWKDIFIHKVKEAF